MRAPRSFLIHAGWLFFAASAALAQIPAFPGAQGFGAYATGGRGGDVYIVTNLNSSGAGSLNFGIQNAPSTGRTIVFAVSGYIPIANNSDTGNKTVRLVQNKITIAGQTAPGDGIGLRDGRLLLTGNNQVIRHLRIRHGKNGGAGDCVNLDSSAANSIIDHVSLMFSTDENISFFNSALDNFTLQNSVSAWGMERHNAGGLWDLVDGTCHHTLWAHHRTRNPKARPYGLLEWINNVTFHWRTEGFIMGDSQSNVSWKANVRGNYFISIPDHQFSADNTALSKARIGANGQPNFALYLDNCLHDSNNNGLLDGTDKGYSIVAGQPFPNAGTTPGTVSYARSATPFPGASGSATVVIDPPLVAYKKVLSRSGPLRLDAAFAGPLRDELDSLLITSVENQQSILVAKDTPLDANDTPSNGEARLAQAPYNITNAGFGTLASAPAPADSDLDGMPNFWESALGWNGAAQDHNTALPSSGGILTGTTFMPPGTPAGYTRLEEYLHFKAIPHATVNRRTAATPSSFSVDLRRYVRGFLKPPFAFTFANVSGGSVSLQPDGYTAVFTPDQDYSGRARFDFTITDGDASAWTQTFGVLVKAAATPPATPTGLSAAAGNGQISLSWNTTSGAGGYRVRRATSAAGPFATVATTTTTAHTNTGLVNGTTYHFTVSAFNDDGESPASASVSAIPDAASSYTVQAESGTITGGTFDSNNAGFNGTAFANLATTGGSLQFNNLNGGAGGNATLVIRFALGATAARTGNLVVNGVTQTITFPVTGAWTTWTTMSLTVPFNAGPTNTLRFETTGQDLANLDEFTISPAALPTVTIAATDASAGEFGPDQTLVFTVARSGSSTASLTIPLSASGSATPDVDFSGLLPAVTLPAGQGSVALTLFVLPDFDAEGPETIVLTLGAGSGYSLGATISATAAIADAPSQQFFFNAIEDAGQRGPADDPDGDGAPNLLEYFAGSDPASFGPGTGLQPAAPTAPGIFAARFPRAKNRPDVAGTVVWSTDLATWRSSGQSDGTRTITLAAAVVSATDPEIVEINATASGGPAPERLFLRLVVE